MHNIEVLKFLKEKWSINELKFICKYHRPRHDNGEFKGDFGFFEQFINPHTFRSVFYPRPKDAKEDFKSKISFKQNMAEGLIDGHYYQVKLDCDTRANKSNPYSLHVFDVDIIDQEDFNKKLTSSKKCPNTKLRVFDNDILDQFLEDNKIAENKFYGEFIVNDKGNGHLTNIMSVDEGHLLLFKGFRQNIFVKDSFLKLEKNTFYEFSLKSVVQKGDRLIIDVKDNSFNKEELNPYKEFIRLRFERLNNPEANRMIANLMREIGKGLYSSKQRMIFELLQNADDAPADSPINFHIDTCGDYFMIMHNGVPFNRDDVEAITSAAESTKRADQKKTGYKGIGFKSVFTDSQQVLINSGGFNFEFRKKAKVFEDFDDFYFSQQRYIDYPNLLKEDKLKYKKQRNEFNGVRDIPWHVVPLWLDKSPQILKDTDFGKYNNNVKFAIKFGEDKIPSYLEAIRHFSSFPQFILFLRNTELFKSSKNGVVIRKKGKNPVKIIKELKGHIVETLYYLKHDILDIPVTNEALDEMDIDLVKDQKKNDYGDISYFFKNKSGSEVENIPPKLAAFDNTQLTFALPIINDIIIAEKRYLNNISYSSLFTYLPMKEMRFQMPFLINADFVPSSDRESIQGDNPWNIYIMAKIANEHINLLENLAQKSIAKLSYYSHYLSFLLKEPIQADDSAQPIINKYNDIYLKRIKDANIVLIDNNEVTSCDNVVIDKSGISEIFGNELFYEITKTDKRIPHSEIESKYLEYEYLKVEVYDDILDCLYKDNLDVFGEAVLKLSDKKYIQLLEWLDSNATQCNILYFKDIPFLKHNEKVFSINSILELDDVWVLTEEVQAIREVLSSLGYDVVDLNVSEYSEIALRIRSIQTYVNDQNQAYNRIVDHEGIVDLSPKLKSSLMLFFLEGAFMKGIGEAKYVKELKLYVNQAGCAMPLCELIEPTGVVCSSTLGKYAINNDEFACLPHPLKSSIINESNIFKRFILVDYLFDSWSVQFKSANIEKYVEEISLWYKKIDDVDSISRSEWDAIKWLYIDDENRFYKSEDVFCPASLYNLNEEEYEIVSNFMEPLFFIPQYESSKLISLLGLTCEQSDVCSMLKEGAVLLNVNDTNIFLDWLEDNKDNNFFSSWSFKQKGNEGYELYKHSSNIYNSSSMLHEYIDGIESFEEELIPLPLELCSGNRNAIGLLQGDYLLNRILESELYDHELVQFFTIDITVETFLLFINNLQEFNLFSSRKYGNECSEHKVIFRLLSIIKDDASGEYKDILSAFREKIFIDGKLLSEQNITDQVRFEIDGKSYELKLSDIIPSFKGETNILSEVIDSFVDLSQKSKLKKLIFQTEQLAFDNIFEKIDEDDCEYLSPYQIVYLQMWNSFRQEKFSNYKEKKSCKEPFDVALSKEEGVLNTEIIELYLQLLDICFEKEWKLIDDFIFYEFNPFEFVTSDLRLDSEVLPEWIRNWTCSSNDEEKRKLFLNELGVHGNNSLLNKFRTCLSKEGKNEDTIHYYNKLSEIEGTELVLINSLTYLSKYSNACITSHIDITTKIINDYYTEEESDEILFPVIEKFYNGSIVYKLCKLDSSINLYNLDCVGAEYKSNVYDKFSNEAGVFVDNKIPENYLTYLNVNEEDVSIDVDKEYIEANRKLYDELFYKSWKYKEQYKIYILKEKSSIPYVLSYGEMVIGEVVKDEIFSVEYNGDYYVVGSKIEYLSQYLPEEFLDDIKKDFGLWKIQCDNDPSLLKDDYDEPYSAEIEKLISDKFGIDDSSQKGYSYDALKKTLNSLSNKGYDLSNISKCDSNMIFGIEDPQGNDSVCIYRSAKGGLLYLTPKNWYALGDSNTIMSVVYPNGTPIFFHTQEELLKEKLNINLLFKVENMRNPADVTKVMQSLESQNPHLLMLTSENMRDKLYKQLERSKHIDPTTERSCYNDDFEV